MVCLDSLPPAVFTTVLECLVRIGSPGDCGRLVMVSRDMRHAVGSAQGFFRQLCIKQAFGSPQRLTATALSSIDEDKLYYLYYSMRMGIRRQVRRFFSLYQPFLPAPARAALQPGASAALLAAQAQRLGLTEGLPWELWELLRFRNGQEYARGAEFAFDTRLLPAEELSCEEVELTGLITLSMATMHEETAATSAGHGHAHLHMGMRTEMLVSFRKDTAVEVPHVDAADIRQGVPSMSLLLEPGQGLQMKSPHPNASVSGSQLPAPSFEAASLVPRSAEAPTAHAASKSVAAQAHGSVVSEPAGPVRATSPCHSSSLPGEQHCSATRTVQCAADAAAAKGTTTSAAGCSIEGGGHDPAADVHAEPVQQGSLGIPLQNQLVRMVVFASNTGNSRHFMMAADSGHVFMKRGMGVVLYAAGIKAWLQRLLA